MLICVFMFQWHNWLSAIYCYFCFECSFESLFGEHLLWSIMRFHHMISLTKSQLYERLFSYSIVYGNRKPMVKKPLKHINFCVFMLVFIFNNKVDFTVCLSDAHIVIYFIESLWNVIKSTKLYCFAAYSASFDFYFHSF